MPLNNDPFFLFQANCDRLRLFAGYTADDVIPMTSASTYADVISMTSASMYLLQRYNMPTANADADEDADALRPRDSGYQCADEKVCDMTG